MFFVTKGEVVTQFKTLRWWSLNKPNAALVAQDSSPAPKTIQTSSDGLICPADTIFDKSAILTRIADELGADASEKDVRATTVSILREARKHGMATIAEAFRAQPFAARPTTRSYSWLTDQIVCIILETAQQRLHPLSNPTESERLSLIAVGGSGRGEMAPFSDVDLLFLTPYKITPWAESVIESMLYMLWDLKLKVGHASRTVKECLRLAREDYTIRTSLVEHRYLAGDIDLAKELGEQLWSNLFASTAQDFIEAKLNEREERHRKQGGQRYMVEPNVKEGKGGLRDLQSLFWISKYVHGVKDAADLVGVRVFTTEEFQTFVTAEDFLWAGRCHLHLLSGRATDQLTFDMQVEIAQAMGYRDHGGRRAVEHFMQAYFRQATRVGELTRTFLTALEANHTKKEPMLVRLFGRRKRAKAPYAIKQNRLTIADEKAFFSDANHFYARFDTI